MSIKNLIFLNISLMIFLAITVKVSFYAPVEKQVKLTVVEVVPTTVRKSSVKIKRLSLKEKKALVNVNNIAKKLLFKESSNDYTKINSKGYIGGYQFGVAMAEDVGMLKKGEFKRFLKLKISQKLFFKKYAKWSKGLSLKKFLNNKKVQDKFFKRSLFVNFKYLSRKGVLTNETSLPQIQGYIVAAHLKGANAVKLWVRGTLKKKTDGYGTHIASYYKIGYYA